MEYSKRDAVNPAEENACFRLLDLPPENRRQILGLVMPYTIYKKFWGAHWWISGNTALLRTCQQLHSEGSSILYSTNTFAIELSLDRCPQFIKWSSRHGTREFPMLSCFRRNDLQRIRKIELGISSFDVDIGLGKYNITNMGGLALGLREEARKLVQALSQQRDTLRLARVLWNKRDAETDMEQHRNTVLLPLKEAGFQVEEVQLGIWPQIHSDGSLEA